MAMRRPVKWNGAQVKAAGRAAAARGLTKAAEHWLTESRAEVPIEEGTLERSGTATVDEGKLTAAVAYDTPYAVPQHERLEWSHKEGRKAKYLEDPGNREAGTMADLIAAELRRALR